jgi:Zn-dependent protease with chaperone function
VIVTSLLCLATCVTFAAVAPAAGRALPPAAATRLLVAGCVLASGCAGFVLAAAALLTFAQIRAIAELGHWSPAALRAANPFPAIAGVTAGLLVTALAAAGVLTAVRRSRALLGVHLACHHYGRPGRVAVLDSAVPDAFTTPGLTGRIVITTGMLRALDGHQRGALIAHERSHLVHRHVWWRLAADLAAAANPLLRPTAAAVLHATERWADEDAATAVGDRRLVATAIAATAIARRRHPATGTGATGPATGPATAPAAVGGHVVRRVDALLAPPPARRPVLTGLLAVLLAGLVVSVVAVERSGDGILDQAEGTPPAAVHGAATR